MRSSSHSAQERKNFELGLGMSYRRTLKNLAVPLAESSFWDFHITATRLGRLDFVGFGNRSEEHSRTLWTVAKLTDSS